MQGVDDSRNVIELDPLGAIGGRSQLQRSRSRGWFFGLGSGKREMFARLLLNFLQNPGAKGGNKLFIQFVPNHAANDPRIFHSLLFLPEHVHQVRLLRRSVLRADPGPGRDTLGKFGVDDKIRLVDFTLAHQDAGLPKTTHNLIPVLVAHRRHMLYSTSASWEMV